MAAGTLPAHRHRTDKQPGGDEVHGRHSFRRGGADHQEVGPNGSTEPCGSLLQGWISGVPVATNEPSVTW
jgi:hypothetical protein